MYSRRCIYFMGVLRCSLYTSFFMRAVKCSSSRLRITHCSGIRRSEDSTDDSGRLVGDTIVLSLRFHRAKLPASTEGGGLPLLRLLQ